MVDEAGLRAELADLEETLARLNREQGSTAEDAALDPGDAGLELTERMEVEAQVEALSRRRDAIKEQLGQR